MKHQHTVGTVIEISTSCASSNDRQLLHRLASDPRSPVCVAEYPEGWFIRIDATVVTPPAVRRTDAVELCDWVDSLRAVAPGFSSQFLDTLFALQGLGATYVRLDADAPPFEL